MKRFKTTLPGRGRFRRLLTVANSKLFALFFPRVWNVWASSSTTMLPSMFSRTNGEYNRMPGIKTLTTIFKVPMVVVGCCIGGEVSLGGIFQQLTNVEFEMFSHVAREPS